MKKFVAAFVITLAGSVAWGLEGEPIPGADVKVGRRPPREGTIVAKGSTDQQGSIVFKDLPDDTYAGKTITLKQGLQGGGTWAPGNFGLLELPTDRKSVV